MTKQNREMIATLVTLLFLLPQAAEASRNPVRGRQAMVASAEPLATQVGVEILRAGGNAVDAAVAVGFALAVTYPTAGNIGGGGFMLIRRADSGQSFIVDYREKAPAAASKNMYLDEKGEVIPRASTVGYRAAGVPGSVAGMIQALETHGTMKLDRVMAPAIELAEKGFEVSYALANSLRSARELLGRFPESQRIFLNEGRLFQEGDRLVQPELVRTLRAIAAEGARGFYEGSVAEMIAADMKQNGGLITLEDLKAYRAVPRTPVQGTYRGLEIYSMPPPSSGGIALLSMLNILESYPLKSYGHNSSRTLHLVIEAMRRAFADRAEFLGDADFVRVPLLGLISKKYAEAQRDSIDPYVAGDSSRIGHGQPFGYETGETTHYSIVDRQGNAVATTTTINGGYGCGATVKGAGFLLNNEMDDFSSRPGAPNMYGLLQGEANAIAPGKRPLSAMTPTIVTRNGQVYLVAGSPGGPTIINTVLQVLMNVIDHGMNVQEAVDAPRIHHQWMPDQITFERIGFPADVIQALQSMGHKTRISGLQGDAQAIQIEAETGVRMGAADPRRSGLAAGY